MAAMLLLLGACSNTIRSTNLVYGIYCPEEAPLTFPKLYLKDDGNFTFSYRSMGGGSDKGTFEVKEDNLILTCIDGETTYVFEIADDYLIFDAENSAPVEQEQSENTVMITDGTKFLIKHEANQ